MEYALFEVKDTTTIPKDFEEFEEKIFKVQCTRKNSTSVPVGDCRRHIASWFSSDVIISHTQNFVELKEPHYKFVELYGAVSVQTIHVNIMSVNVQKVKHQLLCRILLAVNA